MGRIHYLFIRVRRGGARHGRSPAARVRHELHRYGTYRKYSRRDAWTYRKVDGLRLSVGSRNDGSGEVGYQRVLRQGPPLVLLEWLLDRREAGPEGSAALSR